MRDAKAFAPIMRPGVAPHTALNKPPLPAIDYTVRTQFGLNIEQNLRIRLGDGVNIYCDLYRPEGAAGEADLPVLLSWGPYGKHALGNQVFWPLSGVNPEWLSPLTPFEGPDPVRWGAKGYAVAVVDPRGAWLSEGDFRHNGVGEARDCVDVIRWLADQPWSNGKVGMTGVSYLACIQFLAAAQHPGELAAINPCEGFTDWYREFAYHGGIPETGFAPRASDNIRFSLGRTEDTWTNIQAHPLMDAYWRSKEIDFEAIATPAYVVASWADQGLHTRGTLEAYKRLSSKQKWLDVHGQKKWAHYYLADSQKRRETFFDHFLKARATSIANWSPVRIEVRDRAGVAQLREEKEWPLRREVATSLWLDASNSGLATALPEQPAKTGYDALSGRAIFDHRFESETEISGHAKLRLWVEVDESDDMDLFVALEKLDAAGAHVGMTFYAFFENGPVALGWLRASHRETDPARSTDLQPFHRHEKENLLEPGAVVPLDIELWPSSTRFRAGETLRLIVQGTDIHHEAAPNLPFARHERTRNRGRHVLHSGGGRDSHLLLPVIPQS